MVKGGACSGAFFDSVVPILEGFSDMPFLPGASAATSGRALYPLLILLIIATLIPAPAFAQQQPAAKQTWFFHHLIKRRS